MDIYDGFTSKLFRDEIGISCPKDSILDVTVGAGPAASAKGHATTVICIAVIFCLCVHVCVRALSASGRRDIVPPVL
jgi:hypothetical protein